jgi:hypothetical protein
MTLGTEDRTWQKPELNRQKTGEKQKGQKSILNPWDADGTVA